MDLLSPNYFLFVIVSALAFQLCPVRWRYTFLSLVSIIFFSTFSVISTAGMLAFTLLTYLVALQIQKNRTSVLATVILWTTITLSIAYVAFFKTALLLDFRSQTPSVRNFLMGFGASYFIFKLLSYVIDVYWGRQGAVTEFAKVLGVTSFFPQLPAGPIQRISEFTLADGPETYAELMSFGLRRILLAVFKKMLIADPLGGIVSLISGNPHDYQHQLWVVFYVYPLQLYADFSALTDLAIGIAALFGIRSPENFNLPFFASTISEYWRGWHMSLTRWLTDYVFTPLRMMTRQWGNTGLVVSLTLNMILIGLWHGFGWGYLCFGLFHAMFLTVDALSRSYRSDIYARHSALERASRIYGPICTFHLVAFALVWFRNPSLNTSLFLFQHCLSGLAHPVNSLAVLMYSYGRLRSLIAFLGLIFLITLETAGYLRAASWRPFQAVPRFSAFPRTVRWACYYLTVVLVLIIHRQATQFIYVQF